MRKNIISHMRAKKKNIPGFAGYTKKSKNAKKYYFAYAREKKTFPAGQDLGARKKNIPGRPGSVRARKILSLLTGIGAREKKNIPGRHQNRKK